jgi:hypothetical protein
LTDLTILTPSSKRARIRELTLAGFSPQAIVDEVDTTREYVYKERVRLKADGLLETRQSLSISSSQKKGEMGNPQNNVEGKMRLKESMSNNGLDNHASYYAIPPIDREGVKAMYCAFKNKENAADVIAKDGVNPVIAQMEYERFLDILRRNPRDLQSKIISRIDRAPRDIQLIIEKSKTKLLGNRDLLKLIDFLVIRRTHFE